MKKTITIFTVGCLCLIAQADIVMVHGIWSDPSDWTDFGSTLSLFSNRKMDYYDYESHENGIDGVIFESVVAATGGKDYLSEYIKLLEQKKETEKKQEENKKASKLKLFNPLKIRKVVKEKKELKKQLIAINLKLKNAERVINEEKQLLLFLNKHATDKDGLDIIAHSLGTSLIANALQHASSYNIELPPIRKIIFLGSNMNQKNSCQTLPEMLKHCEKFYNLYSEEDWGAAKAEGKNLGRLGLDTSCFSKEELEKVEEIKEYLNEGGFIQGAHGEYRQLAIYIGAILLHTPKTKILDLGNNIKLTLIKIPAGNFKMGDIQGVGKADEKPVHNVTISKSFWMGKYEVTLAQWRAVMGQIPEKCKVSNLNELLFPVVNVSWQETKKFCEKLSKKTGLQIRLPTEAEWEYACRARSSTKYYNGNFEIDLDKIAWYAGNSYNKLQPIGKKLPNKFGLYDMLGNVWEWCEDNYSDKFYEKSPETDPQSINSGLVRVMRGGSFGELKCEVCHRCADRGGLTQIDLNNEVGFRIVAEQ